MYERIIYNSGALSNLEDRDFELMSDTCSCPACSSKAHERHTSMVMGYVMPSFMPNLRNRKVVLRFAANKPAPSTTASSPSRCLRQEAQLLLLWDS